MSFDTLHGLSGPGHPAASTWQGGGGPLDRAERVCVIGAGAGGLTAIKNLREYGFEVDCYERETGVGGMWNWRHDRSPANIGPGAPSGGQHGSHQRHERR